MKKLILHIALIITTLSFSQQIDTKIFKFEESNIQYDRIDYSKHGVGLFFITMYEDVEENEKMMKKSIDCLSKKQNLYHTLYYFLKIPKEVTTLKEKNKLFSTFISHLKKVEKLKKVDLYLNFNDDYSKDYKSEKNIDYKIGRVNTNIKAKKICRTLTVR
jgi:hypothetical protein